MAVKLHLDIETFSKVDLPKCGVYRYAEDISTEVLCIAWSLNGGPINLWTPGASITPLRQAALTADVLVAHNANFERVVLSARAGKAIGFPQIPINKWKCTAAKAAALALPRSLAGCAIALGLTLKDEAGKRVMLKLSKPRKPTKLDKTERYSPITAPEDFKVLYDYCENDVRVEMEIDDCLPDLISAEQRIWELDQLINDRGLRVDAPTIDKVIDMVKDYKDQLSDECIEICGLRPGQRDGILGWCASQDYPLTGYTAQDIKTHLGDSSTPKDVQRVLHIRAETSKTSVKKYDAMARAICRNTRIKGMFLYHGAGTGRWAGRIVQLQNLPRGKFKKMSEVAEQIADGNLDWLSMLYGSPMEAFSTAIRPMIIAAPNKHFITADFSNVEGRVLAWLADETWKLQAFADFDIGLGPDLYLVAAAQIYGCTIEEAQEHRQLGKVAELALGFGGGAGAFTKMADVYGLKLAPVLPGLLEVATSEMIEKAAWMYESAFKADPTIIYEEYLAADLIKRLWRAAHPQTVIFWKALEDGVKNTLLFKTPTRVGKIICEYENEFLYLKLPNGRRLAYYQAEIRITKTKWGNKETISFMGENSLTNKWERQYTYGGSLAENVTQATARDFLVHGMQTLEAQGYPVIGHVHDEVICEVDTAINDIKQFEGLMTQLPKWGKGIPLAAAGWIGLRYKK